MSDVSTALNEASQSQRHPQSFYRDEGGKVVDVSIAENVEASAPKSELDDGSHIRPRDTLFDKLSYFLAFN